MNERNLLKALLLIPLSLLLMGNHGCEEDTQLLRPPEGARHLKPTIEVGYLESGNMIYTDGTEFDFEYVANAQLHENLSKSELFFVPSPRPNAHTGRRISDEDEDLIQSWTYDYQGRPYDKSLDAVCLIDRPQVRIDGEIRSLELVSKFGMSVGFQPGSVSPIPNSGPAVGIQIEKGVLEMGLRAEDALRGVTIGSSHSEIIREKKQFNFTIPVGVPLGFSYYYQSRFAWLTNEAIVVALNDIIVELSKYYEFADHYKKWFTRVIEDRRSHIVINAGDYNGLKKGDVFEIYNETHYWSGAPCASKYRDSLQLPEKPAAVIEIVETGAIVALGKVLERNSDPAVGAKVVLKNFAPEPEPYEP